MIVFLIVFIAWLFFYFSRDQLLEIFGFVIDDRVVVGTLGVITIVALVLTHVWVNVLVSVLIGVGLVCLHAVVRGTEDLANDDRESPYGQLLAHDPSGTYTIM